MSILDNKLREYEFVNHFWSGETLENLCIYYTRIYNFIKAQELLEKCKKIRGEFFNDLDFSNSYTVGSLYI